MSYKHEGEESIKPLPIITHYEVFLARLDIALARYPNQQKFSYRQRTDKKAVDLWEALIEAEFLYTKEYKRKALNKAALELRKLQALLRLGRERGFLGYATSDDMRYIKQSKEKALWERELSEADKMRKDEVWMKNASVEYFKLSKMLGEIDSELKKWIKSA